MSCDMDRDSASLLRHRGMTVPQRNKPIAMVKGNVLRPPPPPVAETSVDIEKGMNNVYGISCNRPRSKTAPEPPRRLSSSDNMNKHANSIEQMCDTYDSLTLSGQLPKSQYTEQDIYNSYNQVHSMQFYENSDCQMMSLHQQQQQQQPIYANYNVVVNALQSKQPNIHLSGNHIQTKAEVHAEKQSNSSIDSIDALPFANDNAGTIKQRANQYHHMSQHTNSTINSIDAIENVTATSTTTSTLTDPSKLADINTSCDLSHATQQQPNTNELDATVDGCESNNTTIDSNVLNDIGNMLANLTDELDAMLEEEKRVGLNDSE